MGNKESSLRSNSMRQMPMRQGSVKFHVPKTISLSKKSFDADLENDDPYIDPVQE